MAVREAGTRDFQDIARLFGQLGYPATPAQVLVSEADGGAIAGWRWCTR